MADLDVTELLSDPTFVDQMAVINRTTTVNTKGENVINESCRNTVGSVQPASGRTVQRLPEALRVANIKSFWVKGPIIATQSGLYTDVLVFKGQRYNVQMVFDWTQAGAGWSEGVCIAEKPAP